MYIYRLCPQLYAKRKRSQTAPCHLNPAVFWIQRFARCSLSLFRARGWQAWLPPPAARCPKAAALRERNKKIIEAREYKKLASDVSVTSADQRRLGINQLDLQSGKKIFSVVFSILATMAASFAFGFYVSTSLTPNMGALFCTRRCVQRGVFCFRAGADACSSLCRRARVLRLSQLYASCLGFSVRWLPRVPSSTL